MGSYARFEHYLTTLVVETCPEFWPPSPVSGISTVGRALIVNSVLQSIRSRMERVCKCHGMSGSCSVQVCWRKLPPFRVLGDALGQAYEGATQVKLTEKRRTEKLGTVVVQRRHARGKKLRAVSREFKAPNRTDLVYLEDSPDYCERNDT